MTRIYRGTQWKPGDQFRVGNQYWQSKGCLTGTVIRLNKSRGTVLAKSNETGEVFRLHSSCCSFVTPSHKQPRSTSDE